MNPSPKEKAVELVEKHYWVFGDGYLGGQHIQNALLEVDGIREVLDKLLETGLNNDFSILAEKAYQIEVNQEIEKL